MSRSTKKVASYGNRTGTRKKNQAGNGLCGGTRTVRTVCERTETRHRRARAATDRHEGVYHIQHARHYKFARKDGKARKGVRGHNTGKRKNGADEIRQALENTVHGISEMPRNATGKSSYGNGGRCSTTLPTSASGRTRRTS